MVQCPKCGSSTCRTCKIVYEEGTSVGTSSTAFNVTDSYGNRIRSTSRSVQQTSLARRCSPPSAPKMGVVWARNAAIVVFLISACSTYWAGHDPIVLDAIIYALLPAFIAFVVVWIVERIVKSGARAQKQADYEDRLSSWL